MNRQEFDQLIAGTKFGRVGGGGASLEAARLYFVEGVTNKAECARLAGSSKQAANQCISRVLELIAQKGLETVLVNVPKGKRADIEKAAAKLRGQ